jgi:HK97 family phage portal protein
MKIPFLSGLLKPRASPKNRLYGSTYSFFFGGTASGKTVNERTAMQTTAVYACVRILAETIASLPLNVYRSTDNGKEKAIDHQLYYLLHDEPNPEMTSFVFRETLMSHLLLWGNAYAQIIRDARGQILALYPSAITLISNGRVNKPVGQNHLALEQSRFYYLANHLTTGGSIKQGLGFGCHIIIALII